VRERLAALPSSLPRWSGSAPVWSTAYRGRQNPQLNYLAVSGGLLRQLEAQPVQPVVRVKHGCLVGCIAPQFECRHGRAHTRRARLDAAAISSSLAWRSAAHLSLVARDARYQQRLAGIFALCRGKYGRTGEGGCGGDRASTNQSCEGSTLAARPVPAHLSNPPGCYHLAQN